MALDIVSANHHGDVDQEYLIESQTEEGLMDRIRYHSRIRRLPIRTILVVALLVATGVLGLYAITPRQERVAPTSRTVVTPTWRSLAPPAIVRSPSRVPQSLYDDAANFIVDHETATRKYVAYAFSFSSDRVPICVRKCTQTAVAMCRVSMCTRLSAETVTPGEAQGDRDGAYACVSAAVNRICAAYLRNLIVRLRVAICTQRALVRLHTQMPTTACTHISLQTEKR